jgi:hypothetical protein
VPTHDRRMSPRTLLGKHDPRAGRDGGHAETERAFS